jgi:short-subunit dehydrogenase
MNQVDEFIICRIGFSIARRLAKEGAKVVISSRKADKVNKAVDELRKEKLECHGLTCHVAKKEDRFKVIEEVRSSLFCMIYNKFNIYYLDWLF